MYDTGSARRTLQSDKPALCKLTAFAAGSLMAAMSVLAAPAAAQDSLEGGDTVTLQVPASSQCLTSELGRGEQKGRPIVIAVPSDRADEFRGRGFRDAPCARIRARDKSGVCSIAAANDPAVNAYFWGMFSFTAEESCKVIETAEAQ